MAKKTINDDQLGLTPSCHSHTNPPCHRFLVITLTITIALAFMLREHRKLSRSQTRFFATKKSARPALVMRRDHAAS